MKKIIILFIAYLTIQSCSSEKVITEREIFKQKLRVRRLGLVETSNGTAS